MLSYQFRCVLQKGYTMSLDQNQISGLRALRASSRAAALILREFAARERARAEITVDRLVQKLGLSRQEVIGVFRVFGILRLGRFIKGTHGHRSRFHFTVPAPLLGQAAA